METKKLLIGIALAGMLAGYLHGADVQITQAIQPQKTVVLWDIDDTVVKNPSFKGLVAKNPHVIAYALFRHFSTTAQLVKDGACSEQWQEAFKSFNNNQSSYEHRFASIIQQISQEKQFLPGMAELLQTLHAQGYELQALTNMGKNDYEYLQKKYADTFNLFADATYVTYDKNKKKIKKPMPAYFTNFIESVKQNNKNPNNKTYLFIDDKLENCQVAQKTVGFDYIKVPGNKNNAQFLTDILRKHGVAL